MEQSSEMLGEYDRVEELRHDDVTRGRYGNHHHHHHHHHHLGGSRQRHTKVSLFSITP